MRVPETRDLTAVVTLWDGPVSVRSDLAVASASPQLAQRHGNPAGDPLRPFGPPPPGDYALIALASTPAEGISEYGSHLLAFEPRSGPALRAESFGRLILLAFSGPAGRDGCMRRTQGGLRFMPAMMEAIVSRLAPDTEVELRLEALTSPPWWAFWRSRTPRLRPLSRELPRFDSAPLDEAALAIHVVRTGLRRVRRGLEPVDDRRGDTTSTSASESARSDRGDADPRRDMPLETQGGRFGGAGAGGGWEASPPETGRPPGVDDSARIVGGAAAAAALGGLGMTSGPSRDEERSEDTGRDEGDTLVGPTY